MMTTTASSSLQIGRISMLSPGIRFLHRGQPEDADGADEIAYRTRALRSQASLALASAVVCHCKFETVSGRPQESGTI